MPQTKGGIIGTRSSDRPMTSKLSVSLFGLIEGLRSMRSLNVLIKNTNSSIMSNNSRSTKMIIESIQLTRRPTRPILKIVTIKHG